MAASKQFMNWTGVSFIPQGGSLEAITGVTSVRIDQNGSLLKFGGDGDKFPSLVVPEFSSPTVTVQSADLGAVMAFPVGTVGTFTATHNDAKNGTGTGATTYTLVNAVIAANPVGGAHRAFGQGTLTLVAFALDGQTNPLSLSVAS